MARAAERAKAIRMLDLFGFEEAFGLVVKGQSECSRRGDEANLARFVRMRWALFREEDRRRKLGLGWRRDALPAASAAQLAPRRAALPADRAFVQRIAIH